MDNTKSQKIKLGLFVIIGTILFVAAVYFIGQRQNMFSKTFTISSYFQNINGLQKGNNVRYSGIVIGNVKDIEMLNDTAIKVEMSIAEDMIPFIKRDAIASIASDGLVGSMIVNIVPGEGVAPVIVNGDVIKSQGKVSTDDILQSLSVGTENAATLTADLLTITNKINSGEGAIGALLSDSILSNDLKQTIRSLRTASEGANQSIAALGTIVNDLKTNDSSVIGVLLNDTASGAKLKSLIVNLENSGIELEKTAGNLNNLLATVDSSNSAFNYIFKDSTLTKELESTIKNVEEGTANFNLNMEALKHNFLTRGYFRKLEKQEKKDKANADK